MSYLMHTGRKGMKWGQHIFTKDDLRYANSGLSGQKYNVGVGIHYGADKIYSGKTYSTKSKSQWFQDRAVKKTQKSYDKALSKNIGNLNRNVALGDAHKKYADTIRSKYTKQADGIVKSLYKVKLDYHEDNAKQSILRGKKIADKLMNDKVMLEIYNRNYTAAVEEHHHHTSNGTHRTHTYVDGTTKYAYDPNKSNPTNKRYYVY